MGREALARGETVWWCASMEGAVIYHLPLTEQPVKPGMAVNVLNQEKGFEHDLARPDLVLASKGDLNDVNGALADYLNRAGFRPTASLAAFTVWRPSEK